jgi:hypothetical protein
MRLQGFRIVNQLDRTQAGVVLSDMAGNGNLVIHWNNGSITTISRGDERFAVEIPLEYLRYDE